MASFFFGSGFCRRDTRESELLLSPQDSLTFFRNPEAINDVREGLRDAAQEKISRLDPEELKKS